MPPPDPAALAALHAEAFGGPQKGWGAADFAALLADPACLLVATPEGFALLRLAADEAEVLSLGTAPPARRQGLARGLLALALDTAASRGARLAFLEVAADNPAARALYAGAGFAEVARRPGYYARPASRAVDALVMRRQLADPA